MANICSNEFYASSIDNSNLEFIAKFLEENLDADVYSWESDYIEACFDSKWTFPESLMEELYNGIPNKEDIYIRCLSVEYGNLYHALWVCDEDGWAEV